MTPIVFQEVVLQSGFAQSSKKGTVMPAVVQPGSFLPKWGMARSWDLAMTLCRRCPGIFTENEIGQPKKEEAEMGKRQLRDLGAVGNP